MTQELKASQVAEQRAVEEAALLRQSVAQSESRRQAASEEVESKLNAAKAEHAKLEQSITLCSRHASSLSNSFFHVLKSLRVVANELRTALETQRASSLAEAKVILDRCKVELERQETMIRSEQAKCAQLEQTLELEKQARAEEAARHAAAAAVQTDAQGSGCQPIH